MVRCRVHGPKPRAPVGGPERDGTVTAGEPGMVPGLGAARPAFPGREFLSHLTAPLRRLSEEYVKQRKIFIYNTVKVEDDDVINMITMFYKKFEKIWPLKNTLENIFYRPQNCIAIFSLNNNNYYLIIII